MSKKKASTLYLIRHGQSEGNVLLSQGKVFHTDNPLGSSLSPLGKAQVEKLVEKFSEIHISAIYSSPLNRAIETAQPLAMDHNIFLNLGEDLREFKGGDETAQESANRFEKCLQKIVSHHQAETVLVISHGFMLRSFLRSHNYPGFEQLDQGNIQNTGYIKVLGENNLFSIEEVSGVGSVSIKL